MRPPPSPPLVPLDVAPNEVEPRVAHVAEQTQDNSDNGGPSDPAQHTWTASLSQRSRRPGRLHHMVPAALSHRHAVSFACVRACLPLAKQSRVLDEILPFALSRSAAVLQAVQRGAMRGDDDEVLASLRFVQWLAAQHLAVRCAAAATPAPAAIPTSASSGSRNSSD